MSSKFGLFFRYATNHWKEQEPLLKEWKKNGAWSLVTSLFSFVIIYFWIGLKEMTIEAMAFVSLIGGTIMTQVLRYLWLLLNAPFAIIKEQGDVIYNLEKITDRKSVIGRLTELWVAGTALRNKGESLMHESRVESWWNEHLEWRNTTKATIALLDPNKANQWWTLGTYTPTRLIPQAFTPLHAKRVQMFDAWLERLNLLIKEF